MKRKIYVTRKTREELKNWLYGIFTNEQIDDIIKKASEEPDHYWTDNNIVVIYEDDNFILVHNGLF